MSGPDRRIRSTCWCTWNASQRTIRLRRSARRVSIQSGQSFSFQHHKFKRRCAHISSPKISKQSRLLVHCMTLWAAMKVGNLKVSTFRNESFWNEKSSDDNFWNIFFWELWNECFNSLWRALSSSPIISFQNPLNSRFRTLNLTLNSFRRMPLYMFTEDSHSQSKKNRFYIKNISGHSLVKHSWTPKDFRDSRMWSTFTQW